MLVKCETGLVEFGQSLTELKPLGRIWSTSANLWPNRPSLANGCRVWATLGRLRPKTQLNIGLLTRIWAEAWLSKPLFGHLPAPFGQLRSSQRSPQVTFGNVWRATGNFILSARLGLSRGASITTQYGPKLRQNQVGRIWWTASVHCSKNAPKSEFRASVQCSKNAPKCGLCPAGPPAKII